MKKITTILLFNLAISLYSSPFLTDLTPDYFFDYSKFYKPHSGLYCYTGIDYSLFYQDEDNTAGSHDFQVTSGLLYSTSNYLVNLSWNSSLMKSHFTVEGLDQVFEDGNRNINSDSVLKGLQFDYVSESLNFSFFTLDKEIYYSLGFVTPDFFGFYFKPQTEKTPITAFKTSLVKNISFDSFLSRKLTDISLGWHNDFLNISTGLIFSTLGFSEADKDPVENELYFDLNCNSNYGFTAKFELELEKIKIDISYEQLEYAVQISGFQDDLKVLYAENEKNENNFTLINQNKLTADLVFKNSPFHISAFLESINIPVGNNRAYIDMAPLSPVGLLYRRRDIIENFSFNFLQIGGSFGGKWTGDLIEFRGDLHCSYLSVDIRGLYHYIDGILVLFPIPNWSDVTRHPEESFSMCEQYLIFEPDLSCIIPIGNFAIEASLSQLIPIHLNRSSDQDSSSGSSNDQDSSFGSFYGNEKKSFWSGLRASLMFSYHF